MEKAFWFWKCQDEMKHLLLYLESMSSLIPAGFVLMIVKTVKQLVLLAAGAIFGPLHGLSYQIKSSWASESRIMIPRNHTHWDMTFFFRMTFWISGTWGYGLNTEMNLEQKSPTLCQPLSGSHLIFIVPLWESWSRNSWKVNHTCQRDSMAVTC